MRPDSRDPLSNDIDAAVARVRAVQRSRMLVSVLSFGIAATIIIVGEALVVWMVGNVSSGTIPIAIFAIPFVAGLPAAWFVRTALWPKDPVI